MKSQFRTAAAVALAASTVLLAACEDASVPVTLTAADGNVVTTKVRPGAAPVTLTDSDGKSISCVEDFSERAGTTATRHSIVCAETERVIRRRQWLDARDAAAGAVAAGNGANAVVIISN